MRPSAALWMPRSPLISSADSGVEAVLQPVDTAQLERPARLKVPRPEKMLSGDPVKDDIYMRGRAPKRSSKPIFDWFLIALAILIPLDVAIRRIQIDFRAIWRALTLQRRGPSSATMGTLLQTKQTVSAALQSRKTERTMPPSTGGVPPRSTTSQPATPTTKTPSAASGSTPTGNENKPTSTTERLLALKRKRDEDK